MFHPKNPILSAAGRKGVRMRWERASQAEKDSAATRARDGLRRKYIERAQATFALIGIEPTREQIANAATALHRKDLRDRLRVARAAAVDAKAQAKRQRDFEHAANQVSAFVGVLRVQVPTLTDSLASRLCLIAADAELRAPDGYRPERLAKRLQLAVDDWKEAVPGSAN